MTNAWAGVIVTAAIPTDAASLAEAAQHAAAAVISLELPGTMRSFQVQIGHEEDGLYKTITISGYEVRNAQVELKPGQMMVEIDDSNSTIEDSGVAMVVDVNNKPSSTGNNVVALPAMLREAQEALRALIPRLAVPETER